MQNFSDDANVINSAKIDDTKNFVVEDSGNEKNLEIQDEEPLDLEKKEAEQNVPLKYFGYEIFKNDPSSFQSTSIGGVDPSYLISAGDEIIVMLWGETSLVSIDRK